MGKDEEQAINKRNTNYQETYKIVFNFMYNLRNENGKAPFSSIK